MESAPQNINRRTMKGKKLQYDYLHFENKVVFTTITSEYTGRKFPLSEVNRPNLKLQDLEIGNYKNLLPKGSTSHSPCQIDAQRIREHFSNYYTLHREINCSLENNKSKKNILIKVKQMFNDSRFNASIIYYSGAANKHGNFVIESTVGGEEEVLFMDIYEIWANRTSKQEHLLLILDSNFSGRWIKELGSIKPHPESVSIAAACKDNEKAFESELGGYYTHNLFKFLLKSSSENIQICDQTPQFGGDYLLAKKFTNIYMKFNSWQELSEWQKTDYVLIDYENGTYIGHFLNAQKHNWGVFFWKTGVFKDCKYFGEFRNGKLHGKGLLYYNNGRKYEGDFDNNTPHGFATETYPNQDKYIGQFAHGYKNGKGDYYYSNGEIYEGKFLDNKPHGQGILKMPNGSIYEGNFALGKCNGKGKFKYGNGDSYEGEWSNSVKNGKGTYFYTSGNVYVGEFSNGVRHGYGKLTSPNGESYEGMWQNDLKSGEGVFVSNGQTFNGEWVKGTINQNTKFFAKAGTQKLDF